MNNGLTHLHSGKKHRVKPEQHDLLTKKVMEKFASLIEKLGSDDYETRETAKIALMRMGRSISQKLRQIERAADDIEVKYRLREIIKFLNSAAPGIKSTENK